MGNVTSFVTGRWQEYGKQLPLLLVLLIFAALFGFSVITAAEAAALATPILAAFVAFSISGTVKEKRRDEVLTQTRQKRADVYHKVIVHCIGSFNASAARTPADIQAKMVREVEVRAFVGFWGSQEFVLAYKAWREAVAAFSGKGLTNIPKESATLLETRLAELVAAARRDTGVNTDSIPEVEDLRRILLDVRDEG